MQLLKTEKRAAASLAIVYALRMMGLFMVLPVFTLYADQYEGVTPLLMGLAIGIYGLTQGLLQIPFGMMSDRFGRKKMIVIGLVIFCLGSIVAAQSDSIYSIIIGRALQGMGAVASVVMALAADLSREEVRLRMMAMIGMSIGAAFMLSMVLGPIFAVNVGLSGIFWMNSGLALLGILVIVFITPNPVNSKFQRDVQLDLSVLSKIFRHKELMKINIGVLILHLALAAIFVVFPLVLRDQLNVPVEQHWKTYLAVFILSVVSMVPLIIAAEKFQKMKQMMMIGISLLVLSMLGMLNFHFYLSIAFMLWLFFTGFNFLESVLPSLIAKLAPAGNKGTAMGVFSTFQFLGAFLGGLLGGWIYGLFDISLVYILCAGLFLTWFVIVSTMKKPIALTSRSIEIPESYLTDLENLQAQFQSIEGVNEVSIFLEDKMAYLKVEKKIFDEQAMYQVVR